MTEAKKDETKAKAADGDKKDVAEIKPKDPFTLAIDGESELRVVVDFPI